MKITLAVALVLALGTAASAQTTSPMASHDAMSAHDAMAADPMASVPAGAKAKITHCKAMAHDAMAKNATCVKMMKLYPKAFDYNPMVN